MLCGAGAMARGCAGPDGHGRGERGRDGVVVAGAVGCEVAAGEAEHAGRQVAVRVLRGENREEPFEDLDDPADHIGMGKRVRRRIAGHAPYSSQGAGGEKV